MYLHADSSKCSGCRACLVTCALYTQCGECAEVCPADCILQNKSGAYYIDQERCLGQDCLKCVQACPEEVIFIHDDYPAPWKCNLCGQCVQACGMDVLSIY